MQMPQSSGTPTWLGSVNDRAALSLALEIGPVTRNLIHKHTGVSKPTASQTIARLTASKLLVADGDIAAARGPRAAAYSVNIDLHLGVAVSVTEHHLRGRLVDVRGTDYPVVKFRRDLNSPPNNASLAVQELDSLITSAAEIAGKRRQQIHHLLISVPASVCPNGDDLDLAEAVTPWPTKGLRSLLADELSVSVTLERDVVMAAAAELTQRPEHDNICLLWIGAGLGLASLTSGQIVRGANRRAGEIGYVQVPNPNRGGVPADAQSLLGGGAIIELMNSIGYAGDDYDGAVEFMEQSVTQVESSDVMPMLTIEDVIDRLAQRIAALAEPLRLILDPSTLILGGPTGRAGGHLLATLTQKKVRNLGEGNLRIEPAAPLLDPVIEGVASELRKTLASMLLNDAIATENTQNNPRT